MSREALKSFRQKVHGCEALDRLVAAEIARRDQSAQLTHPNLAKPVLPQREFLRSPKPGWGLSEDDLLSMPIQQLVTKSTLSHRRAEIFNAAKAGDPVAELLIGASFEFGIGSAPDLDMALIWYSASANSGVARAQIAVGSLYEGGNGIPRSYDQAMDWYRKAAASGNPIAQLAIGRLFELGLGRKKDADAAFAWYKKAAEQHVSIAEATLGRMYAAGYGTQQDAALALKWFRQAADNNEPLAQVGIGDLYATGLGVERDSFEALRWYQLAANQNSAIGERKVGEAYQNGAGVVASLGQALIWYQKAAMQGDAKAQIDVGALYQGGDGVGRNEAEAIAWYSRAALQDTPYTLLAVKQLISVCRTDNEKLMPMGCFALNQRAYDLGDQEALSVMAADYLTGSDVQKNLSRGIELYTEMANGGDKNAMTLLGCAYLKGLAGIQRNRDTARLWLKKAGQEDYMDEGGMFSTDYCASTYYFPGSILNR